MLDKNLHALNPKYRSDIDGLRAIAVLSVLGFHAFPGWIKGGFIGVDIFFVISGYLISMIVFSNLEHHSFSIVDFYNRRIRRIFPALLSVMLASLLFGWFFLLADEYALLGKHLALGAAFVSNISLWIESGYFDTGAETKPMLHLWSLAIEEQFYIFWPLMLEFLWKRKGSFLVITAVIAVLSFAINLYLINRDATAAFYWPISRFWELMIGGVLAYAALHKRKIIHKHPNSQSVVGFAMVGIGLVFINNEREFPGWWALFPTAGTFLIISAGPQAWLNKHLLSNRTMVSLGLVSYPLYLWHWPLLSFATILQGGSPSRLVRAAILLLSLLLAYGTYRLIEIPIRKRASSASAILIVVMLIVAAFSVAVMNEHGVANRSVFGVARIPPQSVTKHIARGMSENSSTCDQNGSELKEFLKKLCIVKVNPDKEIQIVIWGDSHAAGWAAVFSKIAKESGYGVTIFGNPGCPPLVGVRQSPDLTNKSGCEKLGYNDEVFNEILRLQPTVIVLAARWDLYFHGFTRDGRIEKTSHFLTTSAIEGATAISTRSAIESQLPLTISRIRENGIYPLVIMNPPVLAGNINNLRKEVAVSRSQHHEYQSFIYEVLHRYSIDYFDPSEKLCPDQCFLYDADGNALYTDDNHLSIQGSLFYYSELKEFLGKR